MADVEGALGSTEEDSVGAMGGMAGTVGGVGGVGGAEETWVAVGKRSLG